VVIFKRGVYTSALRHLAPVARGVVGPQAVPMPAPDPRLAVFAGQRQRYSPGRGLPVRGGNESG